MRMRNAVCLLTALWLVISQFTAAWAVQIPATGSNAANPPILIACGSCGCEIAPAAVISSSDQIHETSVLTDSLWGNLILSMAYDRDKDLRKLAKRMGLVNMTTMSMIGAVAGLSLAQGITSLAMLNPADLPDGSPGKDSYAPGIMGVIASGSTILSFGSRLILMHRYNKKIHARQLALKHKVENILAHIEYTDAKCEDARKELADLIGPRATGEFLQLWQSSHAVAATPAAKSL